MLTEPLDLSIVNDTLFDFLYQFFCRDFVTNRTHLNGTIYINPRSWLKEDGKERDFWHLTSRDEKYHVREGNRYVVKKERVPDLRRSERIEWVKRIITQHNHQEIKFFYHRETNKKKDIRLYLWAYDSDFVVILQKLGKSKSFLVTSFYIDYQQKRDLFNRRYDSYVSCKGPDLSGCEWF